VRIPIVEEFLSKRSTRLTRLQHRVVSSGGFGNFIGFADGTKLMAKAASAQATIGNVRSISSAAQPYIITINNSNSFDVSNFVILNANQTPPAQDPANQGGFINGNYLLNGVTVSSAINKVTYQSFIAQTQTQPFSVGTTVITTNNGINAQVSQPMVASVTDASGLTQGVPVALLKDPFQSQHDMIVCTTPYTIDGTAALTISTILAGANFNIYFYPTQSVNDSNQLNGQSSSANLPSPKIIRALNQVYIGGDAS